MIRIRVLRIKRGNIDIAGIMSVPAGKYRALRICSNIAEDIDPEFFPMPYEDKIDDDGNLISNARGFRAKLPLTDGACYRFVIDKSKTSKKLMGIEQELKFGARSMLQNIDSSFVDTGEYIVRYIENEIKVSKADAIMRIACRNAINRTIKSEGMSELLPLRRYAQKHRGKGKPVVIISDRVNKAGDNGEALFRYLMDNGYDNEYDIYFAVIKDSPDYERLSSVGKVLDFGSEEYKEKFLIADKIISAGFDGWFVNAFGTDRKYMADLYHFDHFFLQHGVIMNDMSKALNYTKRGFELFCTTTEGEYRSILDTRYGYHEDEVALTGLPRYDLLEDEAEKLIAFTPTWRRKLVGEVYREHGSRHYSDQIRESDYCRFYNSLINNKRLISEMEKYGYRGEFYMHPSFAENITDFIGNSIIRVCENADYNRIFRKASVLVTDYSSVNMDFAYLKKPVIYAQFDREDFFGGTQWAHGYFDYERDGFGPVCETEESVVDEIVRLIKNGCINQKKYIDRADRFFIYRDRGNCKRVADAIFR